MRHFEHIRLFIVAWCTFASCQIVLCDSSAPLRIQNLSTVGSCRIDVVCDSDTVYGSSCLPGSSVFVSIVQSCTITITYSQADVSHWVYVPTGLVAPDTVTILCSEQGVNVIPIEVELYSNFIQKFKRILSSPVWMYNTDAATCIDSVVHASNKLSTNDTFLLTNNRYRHHFESVWNQPAVSLLSQLRDAVYHTGDSIAFTAFRKSKPSTELTTIQSSGIMAYCNKIFNERIANAARKGADDSSLVTTVQELDSLTKGNYTCEFIFSSLYHIAIGHPGFTADNDNELQQLLTMSRQNVGTFCEAARIELERMATAVATKQVDCVTGRSILGKTDTLCFSNDSLSLLHFWGTWCAPCIDEFPTLNSAYATLYEHGTSILHIAYEPKQNEQRWKSKATDLLGKNLMILYDNNGKHTINELYIRSFPTYVLIGKNGRIEARSNSFEEIMREINKR